MPYNSLDVNVLNWAENSLIDRVVSDSPAVNGMNCALITQNRLRKSSYPLECPSYIVFCELSNDIGKFSLFYKIVL